jgi:hypothetical protein
MHLSAAHQPDSEIMVKQGVGVDRHLVVQREVAKRETHRPPSASQLHNPRPPAALSRH